MIQRGRNQRGLREALDGITKRPRVEQPDLLSVLAQTRSHDIKLIEFGDPARPYTCIQQVFGLQEPPRAVRRLASLYQDDRLYLSPDFVSYLIEHFLKETSLKEVSDRDVLICTSGGVVKHLGLVDRTRVRSKWGNGNLWDHKLLEVPRDYGSAIRAYRPIPVQGAIDAFYAYAKTVVDDRLVDSIVGAG